jgi:hypothetical protein
VFWNKSRIWMMPLENNIEKP